MAKRTYNPVPMTHPALPAEAVGYVSRRVDRPERLALFRADGTISNTFGIEDTYETLRPVFAEHGMTLREDGIVVRG
ncbi:hypothetical protein GWK16_16310 [Roseomonas sp. JC162]|uniref:Uncharacterized protein n=1 Tax=Neoroseomonas marina TaxID=1232220 RepID=A0A848EH95_9PROT|nr:hypothetical protein [Neoroseomonas marina]NMJ42810.1 hypothetical protein [Neoroseomonas marina]